MADSLDLLAVDAGLDSSQPVAGLDLLADPNAPGPFRKGLGAGVAGVKSALYGAGALAARGVNTVLPTTLGANVEAAALENVEAQNEVAASQSMRFEDVLEDPTRAGEYAKWALGSALPSLALMAVGGGVGAVAGRALGATKLGALAGAAGSDVAVEAGSIYPEALETGVENPGLRAGAGGLAAGAVDFLTVPAAFRAVTAVGKATKAGPGAMVREILTRAPKVGGAEAAQELTQTIIERAAAGKSLTDPEAVSDYINSALVGGIAGMAIGGAAGGVHGLTARAPVQETSSSTNPEQPGEVNDPNLGTNVPDLSMPIPAATPAEQHAYFTQQYTAATEQLAVLEPAVAAAQQAHDAAVARREELKAEAKLEVGQRRTKSEITVEKRAVAKQIEAAKAEVERLGGELYSARSAVAEITPQLEATKRLLQPEPVVAPIVSDTVQPPSAVVSDVGQTKGPLRLYHATGADISEFDTGESRAATTTSTDALGAWFAADPKLTNQIHTIRGQEADYGTTPYNGRTYMVDVDIKNPLVVATRAELDAMVPAGKTTADLKADLISKGYDGVKVVDDNGAGSSYVAFRADQAKFALEDQTKNAIEGARIAAGELPTIPGTKPVNASEVGQTQSERIANATLPDIKELVVAKLTGQGESLIAGVSSKVNRAVAEALKLPTVEARQAAILKTVPKAFAGKIVKTDAEQFAKDLASKVGDGTLYSRGASDPDVVQLHHVGYALAPGDKMKSDSRGLVWFSPSSAYGANRPGVPTTTIGIPRDKLFVMEDQKGTPPENEAMRQEILRASKNGSKESIFREAEKRGYLAVQRHNDVSMRPETAERYLAKPETNQSNAALTQDEFDTLPEPAKYAAVQEFNRIWMAKGTRLRKGMHQLVGDRPELVVKTFMATPGSPIGSYTRVGPHKAVITLALNAQSELGILSHEGFHYVEDWLLTPSERRIVANAMKPGRPMFQQLLKKLQQYDLENKTNLTDEVSAIPAEARAYAFEFWRRGELKADGPVARAFQIIREFLEKVSNLVRGLGFTSMEDIFRALDLGQFAERQANSGQVSEVAGDLPMMLRQQAYSKAAVAEMNTRMEAGELEQMQTNRVVTKFMEDAQSVPLRETFKRVGFTPEYEGMKGGLSRWWNDFMSTPNFISAFSGGFKNVYRTLNTFMRYRDTLVEKMLKERIPEWYNASFSDQDAAFGALLKRTVEKYKVGSLEYTDLYASLTDPQKRLFDSANNMIAGFLDAELAVDKVDYKRYLTSEGAYDKWLTAREAQVQEMKESGYVPLRRYGDHTVRISKSVTDADGVTQQETVALQMFRNPDQAELAARIYKEEATRQGLDYAIEVGIKQKNQRESAPSVQQFLDTLRRQGVEVSQSERERLVLTLTNSDSMIRNRLMHREGIPGFSKDGMRVLNEFGVNTAAKIAFSRFASAIDAAAEGRTVNADVDANGNPTIEIDYRKQDEAGEYEPIEGYKARNLWTQDGPKSGYYFNRATKLTDFVLTPDHSGDWSRNARAAAMVYFIGGSISGAVVNTMSIPMLLVPQLSVHTNYANGLATAMGSWKLTWQHQAILRGITRLKDKDANPLPGIDEVTGLREALIAAADKLQDTELHQIMGISQGQLFAQSRTVRRAMDTWMAPFRISEQTNRIASFIAAYRVATTGEGVKGRGRLTGQELFNFARDMVDSTQNNYSLANRPGLAATPIGAMMFMFKSFPLFMIEAAALMYKASPRSAVFMLLGLVAMTGVQGLPFAETIENLIDTIAQRIFNSPFNTRRAMRNIIKDASEAITGYDASDLVMRGMLNEILGVSMSSRIGAGDFVPGTRLGAADADQGRILQQILGAPYAMIRDGMANIGKLAGGAVTGDWKQAADALRAGGPVAVRNVIKGLEQLDTGFAMDSKGRVIKDVSTVSAILQLGGLASAGVAKAYDLESINIQTKAFHTQFSQELQGQLVRAMKDGDTAKVQEINELRASWNEQYPQMPIMANAAATRRAIILSGVPLDQRSRMLWGRRIRGANIFTEEVDE